MDELRARLEPAITSKRSSDGWLVSVERPSLDGRNRLRLELRAGRGDSVTRPTARTVAIRAGAGSTVTVRIRVTTDAAALTPLDRNQIFNREFHGFLATASRATDSAGRVRHRRLERQVRGVELLSAREKLMAGLPNFATYFGRDMMMTALMMRAVWVPTMSEHVIASVLRKLGPRGEVSHEEALGGQAIRENAVVYDSLMAASSRASRRAEADSLLSRAREVLRDLQRTRENYHMIDDEYQLPVLAARWLADSAIPLERKRAFLLSSEAGETRLARLLRELALVAEQTQAYARDPRPMNLVSFPRRDSVHWRSASWRDSDAGYAGGRFAMDVNAIWVPEALQATATILAAIPALGLSQAALDTLVPGLRDGPLGRYVRDSAALRRAVETWRGARRHFEVALGPGEMGQRLRAKLAWLPAEERGYWEQVLRRAGEPRDTLRFLALSLDVEGRPIPVVNTDPATGLFLGAFTSSGELDQFVRTVSGGAVRRGPWPAGGERRLCVARDLGAIPEGHLSRPTRGVGPRGEPAAARPGQPGRRGRRPRRPLRGRAPEDARRGTRVGAGAHRAVELPDRGRPPPAHALRDRLRHPALERDQSRRPVRAGEAERLGTHGRPATARALKCSARLGACRVSRRSPLAECPARWP